MSFVFDIESVTVWSPSLNIGNAYVRCVESMSPLLQIDPGFRAISSDMIEIDPVAFERFVRALIDLGEAMSDRLFISDLAAALLPPSIVMLERSGVDVEIPGGANWGPRVDDLRGMPR